MNNDGTAISDGGMKALVLSMVQAAPTRFQDFAGTTSKHRRAIARAAVDRLVAEGAIKLVWIGRTRYYAPADWTPGAEETLARIRANSEPGEDGCVQWLGYVDPHTGPMIRIDGIPTAVRRVVWEQKRGPLGYNDVIRPRCENEACIEYRHYIKGARGDAHRGIALPANHRHKIAQARRRGAKLDMDKAREIRAAEGTQAEKAERFGVHTATISAIENHRIYKEHGMFSALIQAGRKRA